MKAALRALLTERIDYAGLFPPAKEPMGRAVAAYASYRAGAEAWALGRFVVPAARLAEFEAEATPHFGGTPWRLSVLASAADLETMAAFNARLHGRAVIDAVEATAASDAEVASIASLRATATVFVEIPVRDEPDALVATIAEHGLCAKVRTGGVTAEAFPTPAQVARFLVACARHGVRCKATAGLHHPLRAEYPLTYEADAPRGTMFGYLNVFLAAALARRGGSPDECAALLDERDAAAIAVNDDGVRWRDIFFATAALADERRHGALSFGSCSFREPLDDLTSISFA